MKKQSKKGGINKPRRTQLENLGKAAAVIAGMSILPSLTNGAVSFKKGTTGTQALFLNDGGQVCIGTTTAADGTTKLTVAGDIKTTSGGKVYNSVWNDLAEFRPLSPGEKAIPGKVYVVTPNGLTLATKRAQKGCIGVCSDTFGFALGGAPEDTSKIAIGISGWILAHIDKEYAPGTVLTTAPNGLLTKMRWYEKILFPERMLGILDHKPTHYNEIIELHGRSWVKI